MPQEELSWFVDDMVVRALQGVRAVSQIERFGGVDREIRVALDPDRLLAFGITAGDVNRQLRATNVDLAGGRGEIGGGGQGLPPPAREQKGGKPPPPHVNPPQGPPGPPPQPRPGGPAPARRRSP